MKLKPPTAFDFPKPNFGIGILIGVALVILAGLTGGGADGNALGAVLGGGVGIALGLTQMMRKGVPGTGNPAGEDGE